jgi:hypothetical protein
MAAPGRPNIDTTGTHAIYLPIDATDQQLYDALHFQYERNAFFDLIRSTLRAVSERGSYSAC